LFGIKGNNQKCDGSLSSNELGGGQHGNLSPYLKTTFENQKIQSWTKNCFRVQTTVTVQILAFKCSICTLKSNGPDIEWHSKNRGMVNFRKNQVSDNQAIQIQDKNVRNLNGLLA
jgi:hypothetical protein